MYVRNSIPPRSLAGSADRLDAEGPHPRHALIGYYLFFGSLGIALGVALLNLVVSLDTPSARPVVVATCIIPGPDPLYGGFGPSAPAAPFCPGR